MSRLLTRALALIQAPLGHHHQHAALSTRADPAIPLVTPPFTSWKNDRYDPYICESNGENGCWSPSIVEEGPPYMGVDSWPRRSKQCIIPASGDPHGDDSPAILQAFTDCKTDGHITFKHHTTYYISKVMNTTGLLNVTIEIQGTLLWDTNIPYWLANSMPIGFQNQTAAWHLGGENLHIYGDGRGELNGNGQVWYDFAKGVSNIHGRPHALLITNTKNAVIEGLRFIKSQMWTMTVARSERVLLQDIFVNSTSTDPAVRSNVNTDGVDTVYANNITFLRWEIINGDDSISMKQNSTNIYIANCTFYNGASLAMGSIGQYPGQIEVIENITAVDIKCVGTGYAGRIKSWVGENAGYAPNGGGGGLGWAKNITFRNFELERVGTAWLITQCTFYNGPENAGGDVVQKEPNCTSSKFQISDLHWGDTHGTLNGNRVAALQCSAEAPCTGINIFNNQLTALDSGKPSGEYLCEKVQGTSGFNCTVNDVPPPASRRELSSGAVASYRSIDVWWAFLGGGPYVWFLG